MRATLISLIGFGALIAILNMALWQHPGACVTAGAHSPTTSVAAAAAAAKTIATGNTIDLLQLTRDTWVMTSAVADKPCDTNYDGKMTRDVFSELPDCCTDDELRFFNNGSAVFTRYQICNLGEKPIDKYHWTIDHTNTITLSEGNIQAAMSIQSLSPQRLVVTMPFDLQGDNPHITVTYERPPATNRSL
ncbi:MAG: lipocalin family protein [Saprospiraceae bacterium]